MEKLVENTEQKPDVEKGKIFKTMYQKINLNRAFQLVVFKSGQKMALRAVYVVIC